MSGPGSKRAQALRLGKASEEVIPPTVPTAFNPVGARSRDCAAEEVRRRSESGEPDVRYSMIESGTEIDSTIFSSVPGSSGFTT